MAKAKNDLRSVFGRAREVRPSPITGKESPAEILSNAFPAYVGRQVRTGYELMKTCVNENYAVFLTLSGAMTPAGLHQSCLIPMLEAGMIDCITTTGANLYHDAHRVIGHRIREIDPNAGDVRLRLARIIRIYDLGFDEDVLLETDKLFSALLRKQAFQHKMTTPELHYLLGKEMHQIEKALGVKQPSLLSTAYRMGVPIFVGAVQDGSIFLNIVKLKRLLGEAFKLEIDVNDDVFAMGAVQYHCFGTLKRKMGIWILGGGVPKNYTLQGEPLLDQILCIPTNGFDIDVQFCVDPVDNGALSSCPAGEGHTWGKVSAESAMTGSQYVHCDMTAVFPWVTYAMLSEGISKTPTRLMDHLDDAVNELKRQVNLRSAKLNATIEYPLPSKRNSRGDAKKESNARETKAREKKAAEKPRETKGRQSRSRAAQAKDTKSSRANGSSARGRGRAKKRG